jgi:hypothetical protein
MFLSITCNRSGEDLVLRRLSPSEHIDLRSHVRAWAKKISEETEEPMVPSFSEPGSHIPNGCGDYQAEIRDTKAPTGNCVESEPFFLTSEEDELARAA